MNWNQMEVCWSSIKGQAKSKWASLTDGDLQTINGHKDSLIAAVAERMALSPSEAAMQVNEWFKTVNLGTDGTTLPLDNGAASLPDGGVNEAPGVRRAGMEQPGARPATQYANDRNQDVNGRHYATNLPKPDDRDVQTAQTASQKHEPTADRQSANHR